MNRLEILDKLYEQFRIIYFNTGMNKYDSQRGEYLLINAWRYNFGTREYRQHIRRNHERMFICDVEDVCRQISIFMLTIQSLHDSDEFRALVASYSESIKPTLIKVSDLMNV